MPLEDDAKRYAELRLAEALEPLSKEFQIRVGQINSDHIDRGLAASSVRTNAVRIAALAHAEAVSLAVVNARVDAHRRYQVPLTKLDLAGIRGDAFEEAFQEVMRIERKLVGEMQERGLGSRAAIDSLRSANRRDLGSMRTRIGRKLELLELEERHRLTPRATQGRSLAQVGGGTMNSESQWDVFMSDASEDKSTVAGPLSEALRAQGVSVWLDSNELKVGDSLSGAISQGLASSRFGVVVLSKHFFAKHWPQQELAGLSTLAKRRNSSILPVWHGLTEEDVAEYDPILADVVATTTAGGIEEAARAIAASVLPTKAMHMPPWLRVGGVNGKRWARSVLVHLRTIETNRTRAPEVHCDLEFDGASGMVTLHPSTGHVPSEVHVSEVVGLRYTAGSVKS